MQQRSQARSVRSNSKLNLRALVVPWILPTTPTVHAQTDDNPTLSVGTSGTYCADSNGNLPIVERQESTTTFKHSPTQSDLLVPYFAGINYGDRYGRDLTRSAPSSRVGAEISRHLNSAEFDISSTVHVHADQIVDDTAHQQLRVNRRTPESANSTCDCRKYDVDRSTELEWLTCIAEDRNLQSLNEEVDSFLSSASACDDARCTLTTNVEVESSSGSNVVPSDSRACIEVGIT